MKPPPLLRRPLLLMVCPRLGEGVLPRATWPSALRCSTRIDAIFADTLPSSIPPHHRPSAPSTSMLRHCTHQPLWHGDQPRKGDVDVACEEQGVCKIGGQGEKIGHKVRYVSRVAGGFWRGRKRGPLDRLRHGAASLLQRLLSVARSVLFVLEAIVLMGMTNIESDHPHTKTEWLIFINCVLFLAQLLDARVTQLLISDKGRIRRGEKYRLLTSMFVHRDLGHLLANCAGLHFIGPDAEKLYTSNRSYLALYMLSGLCGGLFTHKLSAASRWLGASGGIMGLMGAVGFYCWRHKDWFEVRTPLRQIIQWVGLCLYEGLKDPTVDNIGHVGGLLGGIGCGYLFGPRLVYVRKWWQPYSSGPGVETVDLPILEDVLRRAKAGAARRVKRWAV